MVNRECGPGGEVFVEMVWRRKDGQVTFERFGMEGAPGWVQEADRRLRGRLAERLGAYAVEDRGRSTPAEAQPVAYADPQAFINFKDRGHLGGPHGREWMWAKPDAGLVPLYNRPPRRAPVDMGVRVARLCEEASEVLEAVGVSGVPLPDNWRWPLADELSGTAAIVLNPPPSTPVEADAHKATLASLVAAVSLLRRGGRKAAPSDTMFNMMLDDYEKAIEASRDALTQQPAPSVPVGVEAYLVERLTGTGYGRARSIEDAAIYNPTESAFWIDREAQTQHRVTPLVSALAQQPAAVGVPVDVVREYLDARACYEAATRRPNSHAPAPVLKHDDPDARRLREARVALDNAIALAQQPAPVAPVGMERKYPDDGNGDDDAYNRGWNDCLDALAQQPAAVDDAMVERATMTLLGKSHDTAPGIDWRCDRAWTVNKVRKNMRAALTAALAAQQGGRSDD